MNIAEIRQKYPQYDDLSDEALAKGLHDRFYSDMDFGEFSQKIGLTPGLNLSDAQKAQIAQNNQDYASDKGNPWAIVNNDLVRAGAALAQGIANSPLNPGKYIGKAAGLDLRPLEPQNAAERALEKAGEYGYDAAVGSGLGGVAKGLGLLGKGRGKISKVARALLAPATREAVATAAAGGVAEGASNPKSTAGKVFSNLAGGLVGGGIYGLVNGPMKARWMKSGLENIVQDKDAVKIARRAAKIDDGIAENISNQAPGAAENINRKSYDILNNELNGVEPSARYRDVRKDFQKFVSENRHQKIKRKWDSLSRLNPFQEKQYKKALQEGFDLADYGTNPGELGHLLTTRSVLDDAINRSYIQNFPGKQATKETAKLVELRKRLDELLSATGIKGMDKRFELYKGFEDAYQTGLKFQPTGRKNVLLDDILSGGGDSEKALAARVGLKKGLFDAITNNVTPEQNFSKYAKGFQNVLRRLSWGGNKVVENLGKNERDYSRLAKLTNTAENTLTVPEASRFFGREQLESRGSMFGTAMDKILGALDKKYYTENAKKLLNGNGKTVRLLASPKYLQRIRNSSVGSLTSGERQYLINLLGNNGEQD